MKVQRQVTEEQRLLNDRFYRRTEVNRPGFAGGSNS
jgi:hypothetical protein